MSSEAQRGCVIAVDIGGGTTKLALVERGGELAHWTSFATRGPTAEAFLETLVESARSLQLLANGAALGVAAGIAGFVSAEGSLDYNPNLAWLEQAPIGEALRQGLQLPVIVEADSNAACAAEFVYGAGRSAARFLCLTGGTGLGVGMVVDGRLLRLAHGCMGDAGHVILTPDGPACSCGGRGCAEALLSTATLGQQYAAMCGREATFRTLVEDARQGETQAVALIDKAGYWLGITAASFASLLFPDSIAVAGGLSQAGEGFFAAAEASFRAHGGEFPLAGATLARGTIAEHATLVGAAACFFHPGLL
jgi:glucokinase